MACFSLSYNDGFLMAPRLSSVFVQPSCETAAAGAVLWRWRRAHRKRFSSSLVVVQIISFVPRTRKRSLTFVFPGILISRQNSRGYYYSVTCKPCCACTHEPAPLPLALAFALSVQTVPPPPRPLGGAYVHVYSESLVEGLRPLPRRRSGECRLGGERLRGGPRSRSSRSRSTRSRSR